jgi:hypothetical protein
MKFIITFAYSRIYHHAPEAADSIELFSDMLRYTLQTKPDEQVPLEEEIVYLGNY